MLSFILIVLCLALSGVVALQMMFALYMDRLDRERKKKNRELEHRCGILAAQVRELQAELAAANVALGTADQSHDESWAEIID